MKEHISITIDESVVRRLRKSATQEKRSVSQLVEMAVEHYLKNTKGETEHLVTSGSSFKGVFSREETYGRR